MESLFAYLDYRDFIRDYYEDHKRQNSRFSYRYIALNTGIDASFLSKVIQRQKHLADRSIVPMAHFLGLLNEEAAYFEALARFNKARSPEEVKRCFGKLIALLPSPVSPLERMRTEFFFKWYTVAIYELLGFYQYRESEVRALAQTLHPPISVAECHQAITLLDALQMIRKQPDGSYRRVEQVVTTGDNWHSMANRTFQGDVLQRGLDALTGMAIERRDISTLTLSLSKKNVDFLKARLGEIRQEFIQIARKNVIPTEVYQVNLELFPLTRVAERGGGESSEGDCNRPTR